MNTLLNQDPAGIKQVCLTDCKNTLEEFMAVVRYHAELIFSRSSARTSGPTGGSLTAFWRRTGPSMA
ncbi:MAG: hypothetical protein V8S34_06000 [Lawsonibacter sp.]